MVAPTGNTKLDTSLSTPMCSSTRSMVTGSVAALLLVENANNCAGEIPFIKKLGVSPQELVRQNEAVWKSNYKGKTLSNHDLVQAMIDHPKLIERPIVVQGNKAVIGRPTEKILEIL